MRIIEIILLIIVYAIGITIAEHNGWKRGVNSTLGLLDIDDIKKLIKKYGTPKEDHSNADIKLLGNCSNCMYLIHDNLTGDYKCCNRESPAFYAEHLFPEQSCCIGWKSWNDKTENREEEKQ